MKLRVHWVELRGGYTESVAFKTDVIDLDTGKVVGFVLAERSPATRYISLFDGKYQAEFSSSNSRRDCEIFAQGVEAVLDHMTAFGNESANSEEAK